MDYIVLEGVAPYDGRYEFDLEQQPFTTREWGWIKRHANYLPLTLWDGFQGGDPELFVVFAVIALRRAGRIDTTEAQGMFDRLQDSPLAAVRYQAGDEPREPADDPTASSNGNNGSSGPASRTSSEKSDQTRSASGIPVSATSQSDPATWAT